MTWSKAPSVQVRPSWTLPLTASCWDIPRFLWFFLSLMHESSRVAAYSSERPILNGLDLIRSESIGISFGFKHPFPTALLIPNMFHLLHCWISQLDTVKENAQHIYIFKSIAYTGCTCVNVHSVYHTRWYHASKHHYDYSQCSPGRSRNSSILFMRLGNALIPHWTATAEHPNRHITPITVNGARVDTPSSTTKICLQKLHLTRTLVHKPSTCSISYGYHP